LEGHSLKEALQLLAESTGAGGTLDVDFACLGEVEGLPLRVESGLYRIAQEALSNVVQHASAKKALLRLSSTPGIVSLAVLDDGVGFDPGRVPEGRFGLVGIRERVRMLGGQLDLSGEPGAGTQLEVTIPLE
jgi:two-component system NarL family sensor kinase